MILWLKCIYQTLQIRGSLWFYQFFGRNKDPYQLTSAKLLEHNFKWIPGKPVKVFAIFAINNWEDILLQHLEKIGTTHHFTWTDGKYFFDDQAAWQSFHTDLNRKLIDEFENFYDPSVNMLVFVYASDFSISADTLQLLRRNNTMLVSFCWDDLLYFKGSTKNQPVGVDRISRKMDINLTFSPQAIPRYLYHGSPCFFWKSEPVSTNDITKPVTNIDQHFYVLFVGSKYGWRAPFVEQLRRAGIEVRCYGSGWENGGLSEPDMWSEIRKAPVTLGFSNIGYTQNITTIKGRDFEVPLHGGLFLTQYSEGLKEYYEPEKDIYVYNDVEECIKQIKSIRENQAKAAAVRENGYLKAKSVATWESRFLFLDKLMETWRQ